MKSLKVKKFAFNKENPVDLFSQLVKVLSRNMDKGRMKELINNVKRMSGEIFKELKSPISQAAANKGKITLEDGVFYMIVDGKKVPIDIDAPPSFRANIIDQVLREAIWPK